MLFSTYTDTFLQYQRDTLHNSAGEMAQKEMCLRNHLVPFFGARVLDEINGQHIQQYAAAKINEGLAKTTVNHHLTTLKRYFNFAKESGYLEKVPPIKARKVHKKVSHDYYLTTKEVSLLLQAADMHRNPKWRLLMTLAVNTGMRIGEMLALQWGAVDFERKRLVVSASYCRKSRAVKSTKSGDAREMHLSVNALAALSQLKTLQPHAPEDFVCGCDYDTAQRAMDTTSKRAALGKKVTWHTLRHTFATTLISAGEPLYVVAKLLGHASVAMSERYAHLAHDRARAAIRKLDDML